MVVEKLNGSIGMYTCQDLFAAVPEKRWSKATMCLGFNSTVRRKSWIDFYFEIKFAANMF